MIFYEKLIGVFLVISNFYLKPNLTMAKQEGNFQSMFIY